MKVPRKFHRHRNNLSALPFKWGERASPGPTRKYVCSLSGRGEINLIFRNNSFLCCVLGSCVCQETL